MTPGIRPLVAGNWKMNGTAEALGELRAMAEGFSFGLSDVADAVVCLPATLVFRGREALSNGPVQAGGQDCHAKPNGAHTGDTSAEMLREAGAAFVIVGHSERRTDHNETDAAVHAKAEAARRAGIVAITCIGETGEQRENGETLDVLSAQLHGAVGAHATAADTVIAYEPVWAIGTGRTPTAADVAQAHAHIRAELERITGEEGKKMRILYGGSVKPSNAAELLGVLNVDGALVGGASLKAADFLDIAEAYRKL